MRMTHIICTFVAALAFAPGCDHLDGAGADAGPAAPEADPSVPTPEQLAAVFDPIPIGGPPAGCGNARVDADEQCDYTEPGAPFNIGNGTPGSYCSVGCQLRCQWPGSNLRNAAGQVCVTPALRELCRQADVCTASIETELVPIQRDQCIAEANCRGAGRLDCQTSWPGATVAWCRDQYPAIRNAEIEANKNRGISVCNGIPNC
ncbi:MAG: hypothetical protein EKK55_19300 [Rhodocyclaceae bacterium]|nr:MAG: hypothetical protein EKK55_19300 [Rhodocyclaceae bacterium]